MKKKKFLKNRPFDENDAMQMQDWIEEGLKLNARSLFTPGVVIGLEVRQNSGFRVKILPGYAYDSDYNVAQITSELSVTLDNPNSTSADRVDTISLKFKTTTTNNIDTTNKYGRGSSWTYSQNILDSFDVVVRTGTPSGTPITPTVPSNEIYLASVLVKGSAPQIYNEDITDRRTIGSLSRLPNLTELGALSVNDLGKPGGVARLNSNGKVVDSNGNLVEGKVTSVNSKTGDVVLNKTDIGLSNVDNTKQATKSEFDNHVGAGGAVHAKASDSLDGFMSKEDFTKLKNIASNANNYSHPSSHPASMITESTTRRFVTDTDKTNWNNKLSLSGGTMTGTLKSPVALVLPVGSNKWATS